MSDHLCRVVGGVNHPFQKCQHGCPRILEVVPEIFSGLPLSFFILLVRISDSCRRNFEEGSHIDGIFPRNGVEKAKGLNSHHVAGVSIVRINGMVNFAELVVHFLCQILQAYKMWPALNFLGYIEEGLNGLPRMLHPDSTILGTFVRISGRVLLN